MTHRVEFLRFSGCRLYRTPAGLRGVPDPAWIEDALR